MLQVFWQKIRHNLKFLYVLVEDRSAMTISSMLSPYRSIVILLCLGMLLVPWVSSLASDLASEGPEETPAIAVPAADAVPAKK
jgi:hypothetical protein